MPSQVRESIRNAWLLKTAEQIKGTKENLYNLPRLSFPNMSLDYVDDLWNIIIFAVTKPLYTKHDQI